MIKDTDHNSISYTDVFLRNGFSKIEQADSFPYGGYMKLMKQDEQLLLVKVLNDSWEVTFYDINMRSTDTLVAIHLSKTSHDTQSEYNEDVNSNSLIQLNLLAERMELDFRFV